MQPAQFFSLDSSEMSPSWPFWFSVDTSCVRLWPGCFGMLWPPSSVPACTHWAAMGHHQGIIEVAFRDVAQCGVLQTPKTATTTKAKDFPSLDLLWRASGCWTDYGSTDSPDICQEYFKMEIICYFRQAASWVVNSVLHGGVPILHSVIPVACYNYPIVSSSGCETGTA